MTCCSHCTDAERLFNQRAARRDLRRYRRGRVDATTREILALLERIDVRGRTLIDIGGGIGIIQHELFQRGLSRAVQVDASSEYLQASREEAERRAETDRVEYRHGDFVEIAPELPQADIVTLDRVVCCYPDMPALIESSAARAREFYALSYPREHAGTRVGVACANLWFRLRRSDFRSYIHPPRGIDAELRAQGLREIATARTLVWHIALYGR